MSTADVVSIMTSVVSAFATVILVILTANYVRLTRQISETTARQREPEIIVDLIIEGSLATAVFTNTGIGTAYDVRIEARHGGPWRTRDTGTLPAFQDGIASFPPGRRMSFHVGIFDWLHDEGQEDAYIEFSVSWTGPLGGSQSRVERYRMKDFSGSLIEKAALSSISKHLEDLARSAKDSARLGLRRNSVRCPVCDEAIRPKAKKCPHCLEQISMAVVAPVPIGLEIEGKIGVAEKDEELGES